MKITVLAGGVGGAKLVDGLARIVDPADLTVIVNTGDDFIHLGLQICPDLDTVCYTLAGIANPDTGWGRKDESWAVISQIERLGGPAWFRLGDQDLATHLERTRRLQTGQSLSEVTRSFCEAWGVSVRVLPMSDRAVSTWVETDELGWLPFQEYFVKQRCAPRVKNFNFREVSQAEPAPGVLNALRESDLIVIAPSNPWVSIGPILSIPGVLNELRERKDCIAVSPLIGGKAIKGPAAKMYTEMGLEPSNLTVAQQYRAFVKVLVIDEEDQEETESIEKTGVTASVTKTYMKSIVDREFLAQEVLRIWSSLGGQITS
jgi:LPPG:FO 2-phospho-L-lactate transferase